MGVEVVGDLVGVSVGVRVVGNWGGDLARASATKVVGDLVGKDVVGVKVGVADGRGVGDAEGPGVGDVVGSIVGLAVGQVPLR